MKKESCSKITKIGIPMNSFNKKNNLNLIFSQSKEEWLKENSLELSIIHKLNMNKSNSIYIGRQSKSKT